MRRTAVLSVLLGIAGFVLVGILPAVSPILAGKPSDEARPPKMDRPSLHQRYMTYAAEMAKWMTDEQLIDAIQAANEEQPRPSEQEEGKEPVPLHRLKTAALRQRYVELATETARSMTHDQLIEADKAVRHAMKQLATEKKAQARLHEALRVLKSVTRDYPETIGAQVAEAGISTLEESSFMDHQFPAGP